MKMFSLRTFPALRTLALVSAIAVLRSSLVCAQTTAPAAAAPASPTPTPIAASDVQRMLTELKSLQALAKTSAAASLDRKLRTLAEASKDVTSAMSLYEQAYRGVNFAGARDETHQFNEWKKKNADQLKEIRDGVKAHIDYLSLSLQAARMEKIDSLLPRLQAFADSVLANPDWGKGKENPLKVSIHDSVVTKWLNLDPHLPKNAWQEVAGQGEGIYAKTILPAWRRQKNAALVRYWDARLERESMAAKETLRDEAVEQFQKRARPALLWNRASDLALLGYTAEAAKSMLAVLKLSTDHPRFAEWAQELEALLGGTPPAAPAPQ